jgi:hypothetical protein
MILAATSLSLAACDDSRMAGDDALADARDARNTGSYQQPKTQPTDNSAVLNNGERPSSGKVTTPPPANSDRPH